MRLIIQPDYQYVSQWAAHYVAAKIKAANPTPEKPFVLGCPTGSSPLGIGNVFHRLLHLYRIAHQFELALFRKFSHTLHSSSCPCEGTEVAQITSLKFANQNLR